LETVATVLAPHTVNVHLKDFTVRRLSHLFGFVIEGTPLGDGRLEERRLKHMLARMPRCQSVTLEHWVPPAEDLAATIARESAWCVRSTATLRRWWPGVLREAAA
jgi:3-oxoisoapionate decarboxylase